MEGIAMKHFQSTVLFLTLSFAATVSGADTIWLTNGDRISGEITEIANDTISVKTELMGKVDVPVANVIGIDTEAPIAFRRGDDEIEEGELVYSDDTQKVLVDAVESEAAVSSITHAAPTREALEKVIEKVERIWSGTFDAAVTGSGGESDEIDATFDIKLIRKRPIHTLTLKLDTAYEETDSEIDERKILGEAKWEYFFNGESFYAYGTLMAEHDEDRHLESRYILGAGVGYTLVEGPRRKLTGEIGLNYAWERWVELTDAENDAAKKASRSGSLGSLYTLASQIGMGTRTPSLSALFDGAGNISDYIDPPVDQFIRQDNYPLGRLALTYTRSLFRTSKIEDQLRLFLDLDELSRFRITNEIEFTTPILHRLSLHASLETEYDSEPGAGDVEELDNTLKLGLRYNF
jgi:putative salt-induced outer membrane protein YdiY